MRIARTSRRGRGYCPVLDTTGTRRWPVAVESAEHGDYTRSVAQPPRERDLHRLAEERSLAYHCVIAQRLGLDPSVLGVARARVRGWLDAEHPPAYARAWNEILQQEVGAIASFLVDRGEWARELRQSSPFAGALSPRERWTLWREVREHASTADDA